MTKHLRLSLAAFAALGLALVGCEDDAADAPADVDIEEPAEPDVEIEEPDVDVEEPTDGGADTGGDTGADAGTTG